MLEPRVQDLFDAMELRTPEILHLFKTDIEMTTEVAQASIVHQDSDQHSDGSWKRCQGDRQDLGVVQHWFLNLSTIRGWEFSIYCRSAKVNSEFPAATAMYWRPFTE
jgi:hypothetical protein